MELEEGWRSSYAASRLCPGVTGIYTRVNTHGTICPQKGLSPYMLILKGKLLNLPHVLEKYKKKHCFFPKNCCWELRKATWPYFISDLEALVTQKL